MKKITLIVAILITLCAQSQNLSDCPDFIIENDYGRQLDTHFQKLYPDYSKYADTTAIFFSLENLRLLMKKLKVASPNTNGFKIYLGEYKSSKKIQLIFRAMTGKKERGKYYILNSNDLILEIGDIQASQLVQNYRELTLGYTDSVLERTVGKKGNTTSYLYGRGMLQDIAEEIDTLSKYKSFLSGVKFTLGAYPDNEYNPEPQRLKTDVKDRIMIGFVVVDKKQNPIYLDTLQKRPGCIIPPLRIINGEKTLPSNGDTGVPCPPGNGCGTPSLPK